MTKYRIVIFFILSVIQLYCLDHQLHAQVDYRWWNEKHQWDGVTHWTQYIILTPAYMGPNALPVPDLNDGRVKAQHQMETGGEGHYSGGDRTGNLYLSYNFPLFSDRAAFSLTYRPVEIYQTDTLIRDARRSREKEPSGYSLGDLYFSTTMQITGDHAFLPDIVLGLHFKTASGTNLMGARHTDTPGYWFEATAGKSFFEGGKILRELRPYAKVGFLAYQTYKLNHYQNDAFLYGGGIKLSLPGVNVHHQCTGYSGYFNEGDRPVVYRLILETPGDRPFNWKLMLQQGLHDYGYTSLRFTMLFKLTP